VNSLSKGQGVKPTTALLLGATLDSDNRGIGALAMGALAILLHQDEGCEIRFVDYGYLSTTKVVQVNGKSVSVPLVNLRFSKKVWLRNNIVWLLTMSMLMRISGAKLRPRILAANPWLRQLAEADVAVAVSGGDSFSDIYGLGRFLYMALPQLLVILLRRPLILLPQTIGPMRSPIARYLAKYIIDRARVSYSRDVDGVNNTFQSLGLKQGRTKVLFGYDMGFVLEPRKPDGMDTSLLHQFANTSRPLVGVNISGLLRIGGYTGNNMFSLKCDYQELVERLLVFLIESKQANVLLVPHVFGAAAESDIAAIEAIYAKMKDRFSGQLARVIETLDQGEIKYVIGQCDMFIGSRMHACIAALSQAVPAVGIAYSQKFVGVLSSVGVGHWVADPRLLTIKQILQMVDRAFAERQVIRSQLMKTMPEVKNKVLNILAAVA
jgi:colanic acid/amylovoran biosynthesis protein